MIRNNKESEISVVINYSISLLCTELNICYKGIKTTFEKFALKKSKYQIPSFDQNQSANYRENETENQSLEDIQKWKRVSRYFRTIN